MDKVNNVEHQLDMFDREGGKFYFGDDSVNVTRNQDGTKEYRFGEDMDVFAERVLGDNNDMRSLAMEFADALLENDVLYKALEFANREDNIIFNIKGKVVKLPINDVFNAKYHIEREDYFIKRKEAEKPTSFLRRTQKKINNFLTR